MEMKENVTIDINTNDVQIKEIFGIMLYDSFMERNFVLFDLLMDLWNDKWQNSYGKINLSKFCGNGNDNEGNHLLNMIYREHGNGENERNLSMVCIYKMLHFFLKQFNEYVLYKTKLV